MESIQYWHWLIFGMVMIVLEILVFGAFFLWLGIAALVVGLTAFMLPVLLWPHQVLIWAILSVIGAFGWQLYRKKHPAVNVAPTMNRRGEQYVGRHFTLTKDIVNGIGEIRVDDTHWKVVSYKDYSAGVKVKVTGVEGTSLRVEEFIS